MKNYLTLLFFLSVVFCTKAQESQEINRALDILSQRDFGKVKAGLEDLVNEFPQDIEKDKFKFYSNHHYYLNYDFDLSFYNLKFYRTLSFDKGVWSNEEYNLNIIFTNRDSLITHIQFNRTNSNKEPFSIMAYCDSLNLQHKISVHDSIYFTKTQFDCNNLPFFAPSYYSPLCNRRGSAKFDQMIEDVNQGNVIELESQLKAFNMAEKVYGYKGLYFLRKKGFELSEEHKSMMDSTKNLLATVPTDLDIKPVMLLIYEKGLDREFDGLVEVGKIKIE